MPNFLCPAMLALAAMLAPLRAEPSVVITLFNVAPRIHDQNPELAAARLRIDEALGRLRQSGRLTNPDLASSLEHRPRFREGRFEIGISQRFPITDRLRMEKEISTTALKTAEAEVREAERLLVGKARECVVKLIASRQRRELLREQVNQSKQFAQQLADAAAVGEISALDAGQAKLEALGLGTEIRQKEAEETALIGELKPMLGMLPGESLSVGGTLPEPAAPTVRPDPARRPDFQVAQLTALAAGQAVALEYARRYDDVEGGLFASAERIEDVPQGYENEAMIGVRFRFTLPFWNRNEGAIHEATARKARRELEATTLSRGILIEAEAANAEMQEWTKVIREIDATLLPLAAQQTELAENAYRNAHGEIQSVFRAREKRLQISSARLDALRGFHLARVRHETASGSF